MLDNWYAVSKSPPFPKLHMLTHCVGFAQNVGCVAPYSEQSIESNHAVVDKVRNRHRNSVRDKSEQIRRMLATISVNQHLRFERMHSDPAYNDDTTDTESDTSDSDMSDSD